MDKIKEIIKLKELLEQGAITTEEFNSLKNKVLSGETDSTRSQQVVTTSVIQDEILPAVKTKQKKATREPGKKSSTREKPVIKGTQKEIFQEPGTGTIKLVKICLGLGVLLGIIFWYRYDSFIAFLGAAITSIALTLSVARLINKLISRNLVLVAQCIILFLLIIFPVGNVKNISASGSESSSSSSDASGLKLCPVHHVYYDPNAYGDRCNMCVDEDNKAAIEKARKKLNGW